MTAVRPIQGRCNSDGFTCLLSLVKSVDLVEKYNRLSGYLRVRSVGITKPIHQPSC